VYWLEDFLQKQSIPMIIVSHDREFLDRVCNKIVDVEDGTTVTYQGNYSKFLELRKARLDTWRDKYDKQMRYVKEEEKNIKKMRGDPNMAQQVKAKEAALEKYKSSEDWVEMPPKDRKFRFRFPPSPRCGQSVVECSKLGHGYGEGKYKVLFENVDMNAERGERIGFVGPNGSGKSTMMKLIMGLETPKHGYAEFGSANVVANYYQQNQADAMDLDKTVLETVMEGAPTDYLLTDIRSLLGQFMFKGDDVDKKLRVLSGGEKARVALCRMMLTPANLLCLGKFSLEGK
jgi:ATP-binding cassette, subfamily F, member 3